MCNDLPKLAGNDGGIWRRIEVVKYIAKFTDNPQPSPANPHQFLADEQLSSKLDEWKLLFMIMLMDKYLVYNEKGTQPPVEVTKEKKCIVLPMILFKTGYQMIWNHVMR